MRIIEGILKDSEGIPWGFRRDSVGILRDSLRFFKDSSNSPAESLRIPSGVRILNGFLVNSLRILKRFLEDSFGTPDGFLEHSLKIP